MPAADSMPHGEVVVARPASGFLARLLAFLTGTLVLLGAAIISLGTALLAPIGTWALSVSRRKRHQPATRSATWVVATT